MQEKNDIQKASWQKSLQQNPIRRENKLKHYYKREEVELTIEKILEQKLREQDLKGLQCEDKREEAELTIERSTLKGKAILAAIKMSKKYEEPVKQLDPILSLLNAYCITFTFGSIILGAIQIIFIADPNMNLLNEISKKVSEIYEQVSKISERDKVQEFLIERLKETEESLKAKTTECEQLESILKETEARLEVTKIECEQLKQENAALKSEKESKNNVDAKTQQLNRGSWVDLLHEGHEQYQKWER